MSTDTKEQRLFRLASQLLRMLEETKVHENPAEPPSLRRDVADMIADSHEELAELGDQDWRLPAGRTRSAELSEALTVLLDAVGPLLDPAQVDGVFNTAWEIEGANGVELHQRLGQAAAQARDCLQR